MLRMNNETMVESHFIPNSAEEHVHWDNLANQKPTFLNENYQLSYSWYSEKSTFLAMTYSGRSVLSLFEKIRLMLLHLFSVSLQQLPLGL